MFSADQRSSVTNTFWKLYHDSCGTVCLAAHRWLALAVCAAAVLTPAGCAMLTSNVTQATAAHIATKDKPALLSVLRLLSALPEEAKSADIQRSLRDEVEAQLRAAAHQVFRVVFTLLCDPSGVFYIADPSVSMDGVVMCLQALKGWIGVGVSTSDVHAALPLLFPSVMACFQLPSPEVVSAAADVVTAMMEVQRYPRSASDNAVVGVIVVGASDTWSALEFT